MRNPERIDEVLQAVELYWKENPDLRFMQLVLNAVASVKRDPYYLEDPSFMELLRKVYD